MNEPDPSGLEQLQQGKIFVAGHRGMVGSAIVRRLKEAGCNNFLQRTHSELDLTDGTAVRKFMRTEKPTHVFLAAAKVGGIYANNTYPAQFIHDNLSIELNVIHAAHESNVNRLLFLGSSCIYPKLAPQPMAEDCLLTATLEKTNEPYAIAKIAGIKLCESYNREYGTDFRSLMPTNLYGPFDNFDLKTSHVLPALIRKFHEARVNNAAEVEVWGSGKPRREFLHVDDLADACLFAIALPQETLNASVEPMLSHLNIGTGADITIRELAELISTITGYKGKLVFNDEYPDGTPQKLLDVSKMSALGWSASINLREGIESTYTWFTNQAT